VVIGRRCRDVAEGDALGAVLGYCNLNDVSARDAQLGDGQWVRGKSFDSFCPIGPVIAGRDIVPDPQRLAIACRVNGETMQSSTTEDMIFSVAEIVAYLSRFMTLDCGDVIATGTPFGVGMSRVPPRWLQDGDVVEVEIESLGILRNPVVAT
jgi:2-keto-4-pentenoate hydratase/2-oxohepta-3-ene-1,7-dioic acid hydratase in catechol pathway